MVVDVPPADRRSPSNDSDNPDGGPPPLWGGVWPRIVLIGAVVLALLWGFAQLISNDGDQQVTAGTTTVPELSSSAPATTTTTAQPATSSAVSEADTGGAASPDLEGNPSAPLTTLPPLESQTTLSDRRPASFWAISSDHYELVEIDTVTGEILSEAGGWGPTAADCVDDESCYPQAIDDVDLGSDGRLYLGDCCEPAFGSVFRLEPGTTFDPAARFSLGRDPVLSPSGILVAVSVGNEAAILSAAGELIATLPSASADGPAPALIPLAWLDDGTTLAVRQVGDLVDTVVFYDVSDPASPALTGPTIGGTAQHLSAATRKDGRLLVATVTRGPGDDYWEQLANGSALGQVFEPATGNVVAEFLLPDGTISVDYDPSGTYLITTQASGTVQWFGAGKSGVLADGYVAATW